jgi:AMP-binding enzyme
MNHAQEFFEARDFLLRHRSDYDTAYSGFRWPQMNEFNWGCDFFDSQAKGNASLALWVLEENGRTTKLTYQQMSERSNQVANLLRTLGVRRGDRILLMLPTCVPLWETMLAAIKLGAVIVPTGLLVVAEELADRLQRARIRHVASRLGTRDQDGSALRMPMASTKGLFRGMLPTPMIRRFFTLPRGRHPNPSQSCIVSKATRSVTCPPCIGLVSSPVTCTGISV